MKQKLCQIWKQEFDEEFDKDQTYSNHTRKYR